MSAEEFESWQETLEVMKESPDLEKDIKIAKREYKSGNYITLEELLEKQGFIIKDKSRNQYGLSGRHTKKGAKRNR